MQLASKKTTVFLIITVLASAGCGPAVREDVAQARNEVAGFYSSLNIGGLQVDADDTWVSIYEFRDDGTGVFHELSCIGERSQDYEFRWTLADSLGPARIEYVEATGLDGQWFFPDEACSGLDGLSQLELEIGLELSIFPGRLCNPQLGPELPDGLQECEFEVCGGESLRCGGAEGEE
ncbi:MAG: hypothetical protein AAGA54_30775 [Myxococcota bacterium]